jgi:ElaB/YqjD/DUF883 family membrane-anchored ribosome-binding protein
MTQSSKPAPPRARPWLLLLLFALVLATGCSGLLQNLGAKWVTRQIAAEFNLDEAQTTATRASIDRLMAAAPAALSTKVGMLVATVDTAIAKGLTEQKLLGMEKQVDKIADIVAGAIIDEASPILATLRDDQIDFAEARINERLDEAREELEEPKEERLEQRQDAFVDAVEDWVDEISDAQEESLRSYVADLPDEAAARLWADEQRLQRVGALMRKHPGAQAIRDALWAEWKNREDLGPSARPPSARRAEGRKALLFVYDMLDDEQKSHASEHLHELHDKIKAFLGMAGT